MYVKLPSLHASRRAGAGISELFWIDPEVWTWIPGHGHSAIGWKVSAGGAGRRQATASRSLNICASYFKAKMFKRILPSTDPLQSHKANVKQMSWEKRRRSTLYRAGIQDRWKGWSPIPSRSLASVRTSFSPRLQTAFQGSQQP